MKVKLMVTRGDREASIDSFSLCAILKYISKKLSKTDTLEYEDITESEILRLKEEKPKLPSLEEVKKMVDVNKCFTSIIGIKETYNAIKKLGNFQ